MERSRTLVHVLTVAAANAVASAASNLPPKAKVLESVQCFTSLSSSSLTSCGQLATRNGETDVFATHVADAAIRTFAPTPVPSNAPLNACQPLCTEFADDGNTAAYPYTLRVVYTLLS